FATEISPYRIEMGEAVGADVIINPKNENPAEVLAKAFPRGVDATLEMSGHPSSLDLAIQSTRTGGRISLLGVYSDLTQQVDFNQIIFKGLQMHGIVGRKMWETWDQMTWLLTEKNLDVTPIITHQMRYTDFEQAISVMNEGKAGKVVLEF